MPSAARLIEMGRSEALRTKGSDVGVALIVRENDDDVGPVRRPFCPDTRRATVARSERQDYSEEPSAARWSGRNAPGQVVNVAVSAHHRSMLVCRVRELLKKWRRHTSKIREANFLGVNRPQGERGARHP